MNLRRLALAGTVGAATLLVATVAAVAGAAAAAHPQADSLRSLAAATGLRIGNAVNMSLLNVDTTYTDIVSSQFSTVTPENVMKWETIEPAQGTFNYAPADALVSFAAHHGQLVRGHTLLWHNQLPGWLTTGV